MKYFFELSKEHKTLPRAEIFACLNAENIRYNVISLNEDILVIDTDADEVLIRNLADRLSFSYYANEFFFSSTTDEVKIKEAALKYQISQEGSVVIKYKNRSSQVDSQKIVRILAGVFTKNRVVDLNNPDIEIRAFITDSRVYIGRKIVEINRSAFEERKVQNRPFFSPISLHPKLARVLVNLSEVKKGETLLDPFCGTGGILLEAGLIDVNIIGSDIEDKMVDGSKETLDFYDIKNYDVFCSDIGEVYTHVKNVDAVVTDLPYGKSTTTKGEDIQTLYKRAFKNISKILKKNAIAVIGISNKDLVSIGEKYFELIEIHEFKVHRSLTRYFCVFKPTVRHFR